MDGITVEPFYYYYLWVCFFFHVLFASLTIRSCFTVNSSPVKRPIVGRRPPRSNNGSHPGVARVFYWPWLLCEILTAISLLAKSDEATRETQTKDALLQTALRTPHNPHTLHSSECLLAFDQQQVDNRRSKTIMALNTSRVQKIKK